MNEDLPSDCKDLLATVAILYVEDSALVREMMLEEMLEWGCTVVAVDSAERATTTMAETHFDLLITDINLPGKSGIELAREFLTQYPNSVAALGSGHSSSALAQGMGTRVSTLVKPFSRDELLSLLASQGVSRGQGR